MATRRRLWYGGLVASHHQSWPHQLITKGEHILHDTEGCQTCCFRWPTLDPQTGITMRRCRPSGTPTELRTSRTNPPKTRTPKMLCCVTCNKKWSGCEPCLRVNRLRMGCAFIQTCTASIVMLFAIVWKNFNFKCLWHSVVVHHTSLPSLRGSLTNQAAVGNVFRGGF